jgi:hypothetical protein
MLTILGELHKGVKVGQGLKELRGRALQGEGLLMRRGLGGSREEVTMSEKGL